MYEPRDEALADKSEGSRYLTIQFLLDPETTVTDTYDTEELHSAVCCYFNTQALKRLRVLKSWGRSRFSSPSEKRAFKTELNDRICEMKKEK